MKFVLFKKNLNVVSEWFIASWTTRGTRLFYNCSVKKKIIIKIIELMRCFYKFSKSNNLQMLLSWVWQQSFNFHWCNWCKLKVYADQHFGNFPIVQVQVLCLSYYQITHLKYFSYFFNRHFCARRCWIY